MPRVVDIMRYAVVENNIVENIIEMPDNLEKELTEWDGKRVVQDSLELAIIGGGWTILEGFTPPPPPIPVSTLPRKERLQRLLDDYSLTPEDLKALLS